MFLLDTQNATVDLLKVCNRISEMTTCNPQKLLSIERMKSIYDYSEVPFIRNLFIRKTRDPDEMRWERIFCAAVVCPVISGYLRSGTGQRFPGTNLCISLNF